jgi:hypothetical protein
MRPTKLKRETLKWIRLPYELKVNIAGVLGYWSETRRMTVLTNLSFFKWIRQNKRHKDLFAELKRIEIDNEPNG